jgi:hypothetical protein
VTSKQKIDANRANARASTGPKTDQGRARSAQNALRHGLSLPVEADPTLSKQVEVLAREIAGPGASAEMLERASKVAEAQIDLRRVRHARHQLLSRTLGDPNYKSRASLRKERFFTRRLWRIAPYIKKETLEAHLPATPQGPSKFATIVSDHFRQLAAIDRYERRALSRRKFAIREFDSGR